MQQTHRQAPNTSGRTLFCASPFLVFDITVITDVAFCSHVYPDT